MESSVEHACFEIISGQLKGLSLMSLNLECMTSVYCIGGRTMEDLKEAIVELIEKQDTMTEFEYLQEKDILTQRCMLMMSDVLALYDLLQ